jgi:hypothetical protein
MTASANGRDGPRHFLAYGERLTSSMPLPELHPAPPGPARWNFEVVPELPEVEGATLLGEEPLYGEVSASLERHASGFRIRIHDTGEFDLSADGSHIRWQPTSDPWWDFGRAHLLGRVLATSLHLLGKVVLHGSGVLLPEGVVAFLAPKHFGKSTLSRTLVERGARFVTDDALPVAPPAAEGARPLAWPGIQSVRVRKEDLEGMAAEDPSLRALEAGRDGKVNLPPLPLDQVLSTSAPLAGVYLLNPWDAGAGGGEAPPCDRERLSGVEATLFLMGQMKIGAMLGSSFASRHMDACSSIAGGTPVYRLRIVRDLSRIQEVAAQLEAWHGTGTLTG